MNLPPKGAYPSPLDEIEKIAKIAEHAFVSLLVREHKSGAKPLPTIVDWSGSLTPRKNQGASSACTTHSLPSAISVACALKGVSCVDGSPHVLYSRSSSEVPLEDDGRMMTAVIAAFERDGLAPQKAPTPDGRQSDIWTAEDVASIPNAPPPNVCLPPTPDELASANQCRPKITFHVIDPTASDAEVQAQASLAAGCPLWVGVQVGQAFEMLQGDATADADPPSDPTGGGHAMTIVGYEPDPKNPGKTRYRCDNSWGLWDENGECWVSAAFLESSFNIFAIGVGS